MGETLPVTRATAIRAEPLAGEAEASAWLEGLDDEGLRREAEAGRRLLNRALGAQRAAGGDPYVHERGPRDALVVRVGYGAGEGLAEGRWQEAREVGEEPAGRRGRRGRREADLSPQERVAAVLGGREALDACEALIARCRVDLDAGRAREAALQLRVGLEAVLVELRDALADPEHDADMTVLHERRREAGDAANEALRGDLGPPSASAVRELLEVCERVLRRRRVLRG